MNEQSGTEIRSLMTLLDDDDEKIISIARHRLIESGEKALPFLYDVDKGGDLKLRERAEEVRDAIVTGMLHEQFKKFRHAIRDDVSLEEGAFLIARFGYPLVDMTTYLEMLNSFARDLDTRIDSLTDDPKEIITQINKYFFEEKRFCGDPAGYYNPESHYLNRVLETKTGVPIALSAIYLIVAQKIHIPVEGIGMPGHFIIRYKFGTSLTYVDPFSQCKILDKQDCAHQMQRMGYEFKEEFLEPVNNKQILERMLRNLIVVFEKKKEQRKVDAMVRYIDILNMNM
jgi:regulator of sirC expression with transglutaminase-like and TPR domain